MNEFQFLVPLGSFAMVVLILYFVGARRHKERMEMIRQGMPLPGRVSTPGTIGLGLGLLFVGFGLANVISFIFGFAGGGYTLPKGLMFLFGGIGLLIYYKVTAPQRERVMRLQEKQITEQIQ